MGIREAAQMSAAGSPLTPAAAAARVRELCRAEGFELVAFAPARVQEAAREAAQARLAEGRLDGMAWITDDWLSRATAPEQFLAGAQTVILLALPYAPAGTAPEAAAFSRGRIAGYALGRDYHRIFEAKLGRVVSAIRGEFAAEARATVDYGPLLERPFAQAGGLGWLGKSTMLLVPGMGPYVLLGAVATTLELPPSQPLQKSCGNCRRCIVACPTGAIAPDGHVLDSRLCISYHTIENRGAIPRSLRPLMGGWIFGCDDCLDSCPVGRHATESEPDLRPVTADEAHPALAPLLSLTEEAFRERYRGRPIARAKRDGFLRNVCIALGNVGTVEDLPALVAALDDVAWLVRGHAAWALARLAGRIGQATAAREAIEMRLAIEEDSRVREELDSTLTALEDCDG